MMILNYPSRKVLKESIGKKLLYTETCTDFGFPAEYKTDGSFTGCNRPHDPYDRGTGNREFFAQVTMRNGLIESVE